MKMHFVDAKLVFLLIHRFTMCFLWSLEEKEGVGQCFQWETNSKKFAGLRTRIIYKTCGSLNPLNFCFTDLCVKRIFKKLEILLQIENLNGSFYFLSLLIVTESFEIFWTDEKKILPIWNAAQVRRYKI